MKSLTMKSGIFYSIFGLQIFLAFNGTVWAQDDGSAFPEEANFLEELMNGFGNNEDVRMEDRDIDDMLEKFMNGNTEKIDGIDDIDDMLEKFMNGDGFQNPGTVDDGMDIDNDLDNSGGDADRRIDHDIIVLTGLSDTDQERETIDDSEMDDEDIENTDDSPNPGTVDDRMNLDDPDENSTNDDDDTDQERETIDDAVERTDDDAEMDDDYYKVDRRMKGRDTFKWSEEPGESCNLLKKEIDRGLNEATTLLKAAISYLEFFISYKPGETTFTKKDANMLKTTGHIWGIHWDIDGRNYRIHQQYILEAVKENFEILLEQTKKRDFDDRIPLVCSEKDAKLVIRQGEPHWWFKNLDILQPIPENFEGTLCDEKNGKTSVWPISNNANKLAMLCGDVWRRYRVTLGSMIRKQEDKRYLDRYLRLDHHMTLGAVMIHVLMHYFKLAGDLKVEEKYIPSSSSSSERLVPAWSYEQCAALGRKDYLTEDIKNREAFFNIQSYVWYATNAVFGGVPWGEVGAIPSNMNAWKLDRRSRGS